jgi:hypothetical protein
MQRLDRKKGNEVQRKEHKKYRKRWENRVDGIDRNKIAFKYNSRASQAVMSFRVPYNVEEGLV